MRLYPARLHTGVHSVPLVTLEQFPGRTPLLMTGGGEVQSLSAHVGVPLQLPSKHEKFPVES